LREVARRIETETGVLESLKKYFLEFVCKCKKESYLCNPVLRQRKV
jgi:hypothetical protein